MAKAPPARLLDAALAAATPERRTKREGWYDHLRRADPAVYRELYELVALWQGFDPRLRAKYPSIMALYGFSEGFLADRGVSVSAAAWRDWVRRIAAGESYVAP